MRPDNLVHRDKDQGFYRRHAVGLGILALTNIAVLGFGLSNTWESSHHLTGTDFIGWGAIGLILGTISGRIGERALRLLWGTTRLDAGFIEPQASVEEFLRLPWEPKQNS
jgi:hypothetical protein